MNLKQLCLLFILALTLTNCFEDNDDNAIAASEINDFIWKAMNATYLYKAEVDDLANDRFNSDDAYRTYLNQFPTPESIFNDLTFDPLDEFSFIIPNYINFAQLQQGTSISNGLEFEYFDKPGSETEGFLVIRLVLDGSEGDMLGLQRGQIISSIDGITITRENAIALISPTTYSLDFATYNDNGTPDLSDDTIVPTGNSMSISKVVYDENPIHIADVIEVAGENVGYLMYNGFNGNSFGNLNDTFGMFQANNIQHLVLDLRYNPGGRVDIAAALGSMITGQFVGQVFSKLEYIEEQQQNNTNFNFINTYDNTTINSLNLNKVYVLTSDASASASELVINSLNEYITVVQIGDFTVGKTQASITLFDSPNFSPNNINPNHTYAIQPLVANSVDANDGAVPVEGLEPTIEIIEVANNFGVLGDINEPLLSAALLDIQGLGRYAQPQITTKRFKKDINLKPFEDHMYITTDDMYFEKIQFE